MGKNKHAYLIMAHNDFESLILLIKQLDYEYNDIYIHIDKRTFLSEEVKMNIIKSCRKSNVYLISRIEVRWGNYSVTKAELNILEEAIKNNYSYYHLLSGSDFPLKSSKYIYEYFEKNKGIEYVEIQDDPTDKYFCTRYKCYNFFTNKLKSKNKIISMISKKINQLLRLIQYYLGINRFKGIKVKYGGNWFSITNDFANYVIGNKDNIIKQYKYTLCGDEMFLQTLLYNSKFIKNISNKKVGNLRYINWKPEIDKNSPQILKEEDYKILEKSNKLFARKFDNSESSIKLKEKIVKKLLFK